MPARGASTDTGAATPRVSVAPGEVRIAQPGFVLVASGIGSCIVIALYDPDLRLAGLAHPLLPQPHQLMPDAPPGRFVPTAARRLRALMVRQGASPRRLVAWIAGGANLFPDLGHAIGDVGERNIAAARTVLGAAGIPILGEAVGGERGRTMTLDAANGEVTVTAFGRAEAELRV
jgi:chemotaxis protein CheD